MNKFFKWLFGVAKKERLWTEAARDLPSMMDNVINANVMMSQEFQDAEKKNLREYAFALRQPDDTWKCYICKKDLETGVLNVNPLHAGSENFNLLTATHALRSYESNADWHELPRIPHPSAAETYSKLALHYGIQFDNEGWPYQPTQESGLVQNVVLAGDAFKNVFNGKANASAVVYDNWAALNKLIHVKPVIPAVVKKKHDLDSFARDAQNLFDNVESLKEDLEDSYSNRRDIKERIGYISYAGNHFRDLDFADESSSYLARLADGAILKSLLDAAAQYYTEAAQEGTLLEPRTLDIIQTLGNAIENVTTTFSQHREYLQLDGLTDKQKADIKGLVMLGPDTSETALPLEVFLQKYEQMKITGDAKPRKKGNQL